jgi:Ti-type conjugative transfer relaxase TraA
LAIQFARARYISRNSGGSAVRSAAYNARESIGAERTGEVFYFRNRDAPEHHEVLLPVGAAARFADAGVLWNAAEAAERRKDAQVAREIVLALPANAEVSTEDRVAMARSFAERHFVAKGLAVQLDVHAPHGAEAASEQANWHGHLLITTRRLEGEVFSAKKARDLDPEVRSAGGRARVADGAAWGELWRDHQDQYFREHGLTARVDPTATHAQEHIGPVRMRRTGAEIVERAEIIRQANQEAARDPGQVLATLTRNNATFTERDLDRHLQKQLGQEGRDVGGEIAAVRAAVLKHPDLVPLHDRETGDAADRFTTRQVRDEERAAMAAGNGLANRRSGAVSNRSARGAQAGRSLRPDQAAAFDYAVGAGHLKLIEGRAGTGKSYTLAAIRDAHERDGKRVIGLAPTNAVAQDLAADGFAESGTVHSALFRLKNGRTSWDRNTVVMVDEAAMLDTRVTGELLEAARQAGAKLVLTGDDRQLASIERGGIFTELRQQHGAAEITEVTRQTVDWQRQAARDLAEGRFAEAVGAFDKAGAITWTQDQHDARRALVAAWKRDAEERPRQSRFVFAYTNKDVDALNVELRQVRRDRGELAGADVEFTTKHGPASFAVGDRVQFTDTDKRRQIYNGNVGTITGLDAVTGEISARIDAAGGAGRQVSWSAQEFEGFRHGYAGTIYKGQGKTLDRTYLYHTEHWRSAASYVALTRQRESAQVFVARETARDAAQLAPQMGRGDVRAASIAWATQDELGRTRQQRQAETSKVQRPAARDDDSLRAKVRDALAARQGQNAMDEKCELPMARGERATPSTERQAEPEKTYWQSVANQPGPSRDVDSLRAKVRDGLAARQQENATGIPESIPADAARQTVDQNARDEKPPAPLLTAYRDPTRQGRDSLGRGTSAEELAGVANKDPAVLREVEAQTHYLRRAYRDPAAASYALDGLIRTSGNDLRAAAQTLRDKGPDILAALRGGDGWLARQSAVAERAQAKNAAAAIPASLDREVGARDAAVQRHTEEVNQQRARDAVEVPGLSKAALSTLDDVRDAIQATRTQGDGERYAAQQQRQEAAVAGAWAAGRVDPKVAGELDRFMAAAGQRLGEAGKQVASRAAGRAGEMKLPGVGPEQQVGLVRNYKLGREGADHGASHGHRVDREEKTAERERVRQEERQARGLPPESPREQQQGKGRGLGR